MDAKRKEHTALDKDFKAYEDARKALEVAKQKASSAKEAVKGARAAVLEALKTVSDPPATVRLTQQPLHPNVDRPADAILDACSCARQPQTSFLGYRATRTVTITSWVYRCVGVLDLMQQQCAPLPSKQTTELGAHSWVQVQLLHAFTT